MTWDDKQVLFILFVSLLMSVDTNLKNMFSSLFQWHFNALLVEIIILYMQS